MKGREKNQILMVSGNWRVNGERKMRSVLGGGKSKAVNGQCKPRPALKACESC